ncbi:Eco29kI family restriction endonuclease, partial [bacterium]|nr:Eco29kI family restriction endonuclease [bacterium]
IVQSGFQKSAEDYLINFFKPIWNSETKICFGLGKHGDSSDTRGNKRSPWDTMHPGRAWATSTTENQKELALILEQINLHLAQHAPYVDVQEILAHFMADMSQLSTDHFSTAVHGSVELD